MLTRNEIWMPVLETGARLLAADPGVSVAAIAQAAGVDRRTVYRRFPDRDALLCGIYQAKIAGDRGCHHPGAD